MKSRRFDPAVVAAGLMVALLIATAASSCRRSGSPEAGDNAPGVTLLDSETRQSLAVPGDLAGQPFAISFFAYY